MQLSIESGLSSVRFLDQMLPEKINSYYSFADALLIHLDDNIIWIDTIPLKIYAYMLTNRPIIAALKEDGTDLILQS
jgi:hypothetical protein